MRHELRRACLCRAPPRFRPCSRSASACVSSALWRWSTAAAPPPPISRRRGGGSRLLQQPSKPRCVPAWVRAGFVSQVVRNAKHRPRCTDQASMLNTQHALARNVQEKGGCALPALRVRAGRAPARLANTRRGRQGRGRPFWGAHRGRSGRHMGSGARLHTHACRPQLSWRACAMHTQAGAGAGGGAARQPSLRLCSRRRPGKPAGPTADAALGHGSMTCVLSLPLPLLEAIQGRLMQPRP